MEPLITLGLACNIIQCVQFVGKIISQSQRIYGSLDGAPDEVASLGDMARRLSVINSELMSTINAERTNQSQRTSKEKLSRAEKRLYELCRESKTISDVVLQTLGHLQTKGQPTNWGSVKLALNSAWNHSEIRAMQAKLDGIRKQLDTELLICLR
jgi:hypothetical protein